MFTTGDMIRWKALPEETKSLARRYFMMYPEQLVEDKNDNRAPIEHQPMVVLDSGVRFVDRRAKR